MTFKLHDITHGILLGSNYWRDFCCFAVRNLIPHLDRQGYFEERPLSTSAHKRKTNLGANKDNVSKNRRRETIIGEA